MHLTKGLAIGFAALLLAACNEHAEGKVAAAVTATGLVDRPLQPWQAELLELACQCASALPMEPHRKDRANAQESVVMACLQLEQQARALRVIEQINGWQQGACYAELAWHCAQHGNTAPVDGFLTQALRLADQSMGEGAGQEWRRDRIRGKVARTRIHLGQAKEAIELETGLIDSELGESAAAKAAKLDPGAFDAQLKSLDQAFTAANFDQIKGAMQLCARLHERFYDDGARRAQLSQRIVSAYPKMPPPARLEYLLDIATTTARHHDRLDATALLDQGRRVLDSITMLPEDRLPMLARLATLRGKAGDVEGAKQEVAAALELFEGKRSSIADVFRGRALRPLAEALHSFGCDDKARSVYQMAVEEGLKNPNSRPRAEDLTASGLSMAVHGCEPDAALRKRLLQAAGALGHPW